MFLIPGHIAFAWSCSALFPRRIHCDTLSLRISACVFFCTESKLYSGFLVVPPVTSPFDLHTHQHAFRCCLPRIVPSRCAILPLAPPYDLQPYRSCSPGGTSKSGLPVPAVVRSYPTFPYGHRVVTWGPRLTLPCLADVRSAVPNLSSDSGAFLFSLSVFSTRTSFTWSFFQFNPLTSVIAMAENFSPLLSSPLSRPHSPRRYKPIGVCCPPVNWPPLSFSIKDILPLFCKDAPFGPRYVSCMDAVFPLSPAPTPVTPLSD